MAIDVLNASQRLRIKEMLDGSPAWRDDADLERRRAISDELRHRIGAIGLSAGKDVTHRLLSELISLQWKIQNLNPIQMQRFLGAYAYKVHFGGYAGSPEDFARQQKKEKGTTDFHEGCDLAKVSVALRFMASQSSQDQWEGASILLKENGAGPALVSGFLHLLHPNDYGLINSPTIAPFEPNGLFELSDEQRKYAKELARKRHAELGSERISNDAIDGIFRWQLLLSEVRESSGLIDFHELDQFLWARTSAPEENIDEKLRAAVQLIQPDWIEIRRNAAIKARALIQNNLGRLTNEQFFELFDQINAGHGKKGIVYNRFSPAFVGHNANLLVKRADALNNWIEKLWTAAETDIPVLLSQFWEENFSGSGRSFPTAILHLRDPEKYSVWTTNLERALFTSIPGLPAKFNTGFSYLQYCKGINQLRKRVNFASEMHDFVLFLLMDKTIIPPESVFLGFPSDGFAFLEELEKNNSTVWFEENRQRFQDSVREPFRQLTIDLASTVVTQRAPDLETSVNKCLSRINRNNFGRDNAAPYHTHFWSAFFRKERTKNSDCQFYVSMRSSGLDWGVYFGEDADDVRSSLMNSLQKHPDIAKTWFELVREKGFKFAHCLSTEEPIEDSINDFSSFISLVQEHRFQVYRHHDRAHLVQRGQLIREDIANDFQTLHVLMQLAKSEVNEAEVRKHLESLVDLVPGVTITKADLAAATYLEESFFDTLDTYLRDKKQLIFVGPPGTGKTFVALEYATYLAQQGGDVRTVQFHPTYAYEDFIEGLRPAVSEQGALLYRVEDGIFKRLCDEARTNPNAKYVIVVDEINRGNLSRIFGELLFLLERRDKTTDLPYSKKSFSVPSNVILLGTMNSTDRSVAMMDLALRRRFHFIDMQPRGDVLLAWLEEKKKPKYFRELFDWLNDSLRKLGIDEDRHIGHSHFMSHLLDDEFLRMIWKGTIEPQLKEYFFAEPNKMKSLSFENFQKQLDLSSARAEEESSTHEMDDHN